MSLEANCGSVGAHDDESDSSSSENDGPPEITMDSLSADTLAALQAHMAVQDVMKAEEGEEGTAAAAPGGGGLVSEDFGLSQFWYDDETQKTLAREVLKGAAGGKAAVISAPSVMNGIQLLKSKGWSFDAGGEATVFIFEYDRRFDEAYPESFVYYDFNSPADVPEELKSSVDYILMDPPYLNSECVSKFLQTAKIIARRSRKPPKDGKAAAVASEREVAAGGAVAPERGEEATPMMFITSPLNHAFLRKNMGLRRTPYQLGFKSKFATPMSLYTNYPSEELGPWVHEEEGED